VVICLDQRANDLHSPADATATPSSRALLESRLVLSFLMMAYPVCFGKEAVKRLSVCLSSD